MSLRERTRARLGIIEPCLPSPAKAPPAGPDWIHEIKHDGFRIMARRDGTGVRLVSRNGHDFTARFPLAAAAVMALPAHSFLIDGEAIVTDDDGLAVFDLIRRQRHGAAAVLCAFDLIELEGEDLRRAPIEHRKRQLAKLVRTPHPGIVLNEHYDGDGDIVFKYATANFRFAAGVRDRRRRVRHLRWLCRRDKGTGRYPRSSRCGLGRRMSPSFRNLQARLRRHRFEAARLTVSFGPVRALGEGEKSPSARGDTRGRRRLGFATLDKIKEPKPPAVTTRRFPPRWSVEEQAKNLPV
jgi:bifunctional non-homologous end joining protein LigD